MMHNMFEYDHNNLNESYLNLQNPKIFIIV